MHFTKKTVSEKRSELAKNLNTVIQLSLDELKSMGNEGRKNIAKKFDVETMCQSNLKEYKRLIKN